MLPTNLAKELSTYLLKDNVTKVKVDLGPWQIPNSSIMNFTRIDTLEHVKKVAREIDWDPSKTVLEMAVSGMYIDEKQKKIVQGDLAVPYPMCKEKTKQLKEVGCVVKKIHEHKSPAWGNLCHIHVTNCSLIGTLKRIQVAKVLSS